MLLNILLLIVVIVQIIILSVALSKYPSKRELFSPGCGVTFGEFVNPVPPCRDENDCSRGHPARWTYYENMCQPITFDSQQRFLRPGLGLLKEKRDLRDLCLKRL
jgi:hypothetical protein